MPAIEPGYRQNFDTLRRAAQAGDLALMDCQDRATGRPARIIVAVQYTPGPNGTEGEYEMVPLARLFDGNPYDELNPPDPDRPGEYLQS